MGVYIYDTALAEKFKQILGDNRINVLPFEVAFRKSGAVSDDVIFPFISINRAGWSLSNLNRNIVAYKVGRLTQVKVGEEDKFFRNAYLPISINYTIDICTRNRQENDELCRELILYFTRNPELMAKVIYGEMEQEFGFHVFLGENITDNSEISDFETRGQYYRSTLEFVVDEAQLFIITPVEGIKDPDSDPNDPNAPLIFSKYRIEFVVSDKIGNEEKTEFFIPREEP